MLLVSVFLAPSWLAASERAQEPAAVEAAGPRLEDIRGQIGLFGGFATAGADGLEDGGLFGGSAAFFFNKRLGFEAAVHHRSLDVVSTSSNQLSGGSLSSTIVTGSLVFRFPGARVQPPKLQPYGALVTFMHDPSGVLLHLCEWRPGAGAHG